MNSERLEYIETCIRAAGVKSAEEIPLQDAKVIVLNEAGMRFLENQSDSSIKSKAYGIARENLADNALNLIGYIRRTQG
jgi:hypothetical protein